MDAGTSDARPLAWAEVLDQIHRSLAEAVASVEHQERALETLVVPSESNPEQGAVWQQRLDRLGEWARDWQRQGEEAQRRVEETEGVLREQEQALDRWRAELARLHAGLGQAPGVDPSEG